MPEQSDLSAAEGREPSAVRAYLRPESLAMSGVERVREASNNVWYLLKDVGQPMGWREEISHHIDVTPVHEAGHAVAHVLAGDQIRDVRFWGFRPGKDGSWGHCRTVNDTGTRDADEFLAFLGRDRFLRQIVATFAGPLTELRYDPMRVVSGAKGDKEQAEAMLRCLDWNGHGCRHVLHSWAWCVACSMVLDERFWSATIQVADRLKKSVSKPPRVTGGAVHGIVRRHLPEGVDWPEAPWGEELARFYLVEAAA